jgi:predicted nuclease of predicted toxin-antitoxin system
LSTETLLTDYYSGNLLKRTNTACRNLRNARDDVVLDFLRRVEGIFTASKADFLNLQSDLVQLEQLVEMGTRQTGLTRLVNGNIQGSIAKSEGDTQFTALVKALSEKLETFFKCVSKTSQWH